MTIDATLDWYVPDQSSLDKALARTTHLGIAAHQDDIEIIGFHGIAECYQCSDHWFSAIVLTDGSGAPRSGPYHNYSDEQLAGVRKQEQHKAADIGQYSVVTQFGAKSDELKGGINTSIVEKLVRILEVAQAKVVYLHNLFDRHETHVSVSIHALEALRKLANHQQPKEVYAVEVWRDLDWLPEAYRVQLDVSEHRKLFAELINAFDSQINGGKRYDLAAPARHLVNATFGHSHSVDTTPCVSLAMNLLPLLHDKSLSCADFVSHILNEFKSDVMSCVNPYTGHEEQ